MAAAAVAYTIQFSFLILSSNLLFWICCCCFCCCFCTIYVFFIFLHCSPQTRGFCKSAQDYCRFNRSTASSFIIVIRLENHATVGLTWFPFWMIYYCFCCCCFSYVVVFLISIVHKLQAHSSASLLLLACGFVRSTAIPFDFVVTSFTLYIQ